VLIFQESTLFPWLTVKGNIRFVLKDRKLSREEERHEIERWIAEVGLQGFADTRPAGLSGGMRQRAALARALAVRPQLLLMDEPFAAIDAVSRNRLHLLLESIHKNSGISVFLVTHDVDEAVVLADRVLIMSHRPGRISGSIPIVLERPRISGGVLRNGFAETRNEVARAARELYAN
jgi:ABC-type nitrate/sulfonate/bicarbonate transport system ATPase subunit